MTWKLYPNLYTILVGRPGIGKGAAVNPAAALLRDAGTANMLSDRLTIEFVLEKLSKGFTTQQHASAGGVQFTTESSSLIFAPELSIFVTSSMHTLPILADLWDAREGEFEYGTRHKGSYKVKSPCQSMLAGSAPEWLMKSIPNDAVGGGFCRRVNFVFADKKHRFIPWPMSRNGASTRTALVEDLRHMHSTLRGEFTISKEARPHFEKYYNDAVPTDYDDEATVNYTTTKWAHAAKLAMILSASRGDSMEISLQDWQTATKEVNAVLNSIKYVFRGVGESDLVAAAHKILSFIERKGYASRREIIAANWQHASEPEMEVILLTLQHGGLISEVMQGRDLYYYAVPKGAKP